MNTAALLKSLAAALLAIHKQAAQSGLEHQAIETIKTTAEGALSKINAHSNGTVDTLMEVAASTAEAAIQANSK